MMYKDMLNPLFQSVHLKVYQGQYIKESITTRKITINYSISDFIFYVVLF